MDQTMISLPQIVKPEDNRDIRAGEVTIAGQHIILDTGNESDSLCEMPSNFEENKDGERVSSGNRTPDQITFTD